MKFKAVLVIIIVFCFFVILSGCLDTGIKNTGDTEKNRFIGTWNQQLGNQDSNDKSTYTFYENDTFLSIYFESNKNYTHVGWGDYTILDGTICMKTHPHGAITDNQSYCYTYEFSEGDVRLTLTTNMLPTAILDKVK